MTTKIIRHKLNPYVALRKLKHLLKNLQLVRRIYMYFIERNISLIEKTEV